MDIISLKCPNCGAGLGISKGMDVFSCAYCKHALRVNYRDGAVSLQELTVAMDKVQSNTDRTASELALKRLGDELAELRGRRLELERIQGHIRDRAMCWLVGSDFVLLFCGAFVALFMMMVVGKESLTVGIIAGAVIAIGTLVFVVLMISGRFKAVKNFNANMANNRQANLSERQQNKKVEEEVLRQIAEHKRIVDQPNIQYHAAATAAPKPPRVMYCSQCGDMIADQARFCTSCGQVLN